MRIDFSSSVIMVEDIARSRKFYEEVLGQAVIMDNGPNVIYQGGFSIWQRDAALGIIFAGSSPRPVKSMPPVLELYFETAELDEAWTRCSPHPDQVIHPVIEHPWGQKGFRIYDPDGFIIDISEPLSVMVKRFLAQGLTIAEIADRSGVPKADVLALADG
ncbi:MAG: VOC family protein [Deltaproteobacteria bacterium]